MKTPQVPKATSTISQSSSDISNLLWQTFSKDLVQHLKHGGLRLYRFHNTEPTDNGEKQPLLGNCNKTVSFTSPMQPSAGKGLPPNKKFSTKADMNEWSLNNGCNGFPVHPGHGSVSISAVCRSATPMITPLPDKEGVSWVGAAFLLINAALGIGILNFPNAYSQAGGILSATIIQLTMLTLIVITMLILAHCSDVNSDVTYHDVLLSMCGRKAQKLAALSITCTCYGVCVAILIIIGDQMDRLFLAVFGSNFCHRWYLERHFTILVAAVCLVLPMCYCKRVDFLRYAGSLGIFAMLYPVFLTVYGYLKLNITPGDIKTEPDDIAKLFAVIPVLCFAYQCQEVVVPVYACMKERTLWNFSKSCLMAMSFLLITYSVIGCCGYLTFGSIVSPNVMKMYDAEDPIVMIGVGALIVKMVVTYPVLTFCGRGAVDGLYAELSGLSPDQFIKGERKRRYLIATIWFSSSLALALVTSSIGSVIQILGSVSSANIFVYPGICLLKVVTQKDPDVETWRSRLLIALALFLAGFGAFCFGVVLFQTIMGGNSSDKLEVLCSR